MTLTAAASIVGAALWYAEHGLPVFRLQPLSKVPYPRTRGVLDATTSAAAIAAAFRPDDNIGLATGHGVDVIDFDGYQAHARWAQEFPGGTWEEAGVTLLGSVSTPRPGGYHAYLPSTGRGNYAGRWPGIDYRGLGGYVVVPPSRTRAGQYVWLRRLMLPAMEECPAYPGSPRCDPAICDCFIETHPDSPLALHPEDFQVGGAL